VTARPRVDDNPARASHIVRPLPPGGGIDMAARLIGQKLGGILAQQIVIENQPIRQMGIRVEP
jgi:tripartite-type tricarboxylate transporter receptor subunit TctC